MTSVVAHPHLGKLVGQEFQSTRLSLLREDLLGAEYAVCTLKAELLTEYFCQKPKGPAYRALDWLDRAHGYVYAKSIKAQLKGVKTPGWKTRINNQLMNAWVGVDSGNDTSVQEEFANGLAYILERMPLRIYDHELIVGNLSSHRIGAPLHPDYSGILLGAELDTIGQRTTNPLALSKTQKQKLTNSILPFWYRRSILAMTPLYTANDDLISQINDGQSFVLTQFAGISHVTPDFPSVLELGFEGIAETIQANLNTVELAISRRKTPTAEQRKKRAFYRSGLTVCDAAIRYGKRWALHLQAQATVEIDPQRQEELFELASIFERVPAKPAQTFHEALQSMFVAHVILHQESFQHGISFGRMDQYLYPYLERDLASKRITCERAVDLLGCFLGKAAELIPLFFQRATQYFSGLSSASGITLGGRTEDGKDAVNLLSHLFLIAYDQIRLRQPNLHVRVHSESEPAFMARCYEVLKKGGGMPAFFNDEEVIEVLEGRGVAKAHAQDYSIVGCVEWGVPYRSFPAAGSAFMSLPYILELTLRDGAEVSGEQVGPHTGKVEHFTDTASLLAAFRIQLKHCLQVIIDGNNAIEMAHALHRPTPMLSVLVGGCVAKGRDVTAGGAEYNSSGVQGVGMADVVDSVAAIEELVFSKKRLSLREFLRASNDNFQADVALRSEIMNRVPKYGEDCPRSNGLASSITRIFIDEVEKFHNPRGGRYAAGFWSMTTHQGFGQRLGAMASGRVCGKAHANGASPYSGWDRLGPTASLSAAANVVTPPNGYVINQKISSEMVQGEVGNKILGGLVQGFFAKGGSQVQFNILDSEVLQAARKSPEDHRDLVVRISGYSAYFNDLTEEMKDELIARSLHGANA